ncbi:MAG: alpha/beta fold hydrolase [Parcubacteria group bacterium]
MRIISIHGFNASSQSHFHPWLKEQLQDKGHEVIVPDLPLTAEGELDLTKIISAMRAQIGLLKSDDIIVAHSLSAFIVLQYLEAVEMVGTPRAVIFVAAPWKVSKQELRRLFIADLDADVLMWKAREFVIVHSKDDQLVPFDHAQKLAEAFKGHLVATETDGHFMNEQHPVLVEVIKQIVDTPFEYNPGALLADVFEKR